MPEVKVNGLKLHYELDDFTNPWDESDTIWIQHGFGRSGKFWFHWIPPLVRAYRVLMSKEAAGNVAGEKKTKSRIWRKAVIALGVIVVLLAGATAVIWNVYFRLPDVKGVPGGAKDFELPDGPSIADVGGAPTLGGGGRDRGDRRR